MRSTRLDAVTIACSFAQLQEQHAGEATTHAPEMRKDSCVVLAETCISSILGVGFRSSKGIRRETSFEHTLEDTFPSVFCPVYTQGVSQRSLLVPSVTRALAAFQHRITAGVASADRNTWTVYGPTTKLFPWNNTSGRYPFTQELELQLWKAVLGRIRVFPGHPSQQSKRRNKSGISAIKPASSGTSHAPEDTNITLAGVGGLNGLDDVDLEQSLFEQHPDQARELGIESLGHYQRGRDVHHCAHDVDSSAIMSFEQLADDNMLMVRDEHGWTSYRESNPKSSQDTLVSSEINDFKESLQASEDCDESMESYEWAEIIGQRQQLTQMSGRDYPLIDPLLRREPGQNGEDGFLEALHISTFSPDHALYLSSEAVTDLDEILLDSTALASAKTVYMPFGNTFCESPDPDALDLFLGQDRDSCNDPFRLGRPTMHTDGTEVEDWRSLLASPDLFDANVHGRANDQSERNNYGTAPELNRCSPTSRSFLKRASTVSTSSSSETRWPRRHMSILQRLSRRSSTKSKHEDSDGNDLAFQVTHGREVEIKRRKTLDDYEQENYGEDDEMLFV